MKRKIMIYTLVLSTILFCGCATNKNQNSTNPPVSESGTPSSDVAPSTVPSSNEDVQNNASEANKISEEEAKEIALNHAGFTADQVTLIKVTLDRDDNTEHYDIEFYTNDQKEYDYEIDPYSGAILEHDYDVEDHLNSSDTSNLETITEDHARQIALEKVPGAAPENIVEFETDYGNGRLQYEGKIHYEQQEYEFEMDAYTGDILEWDVEPIHDNVS